MQNGTFLAWLSLISVPMSQNCLPIIQIIIFLNLPLLSLTFSEKNWFIGNLKEIHIKKNILLCVDMSVD